MGKAREGYREIHGLYLSEATYKILRKAAYEQETTITTLLTMVIESGLTDIAGGVTTSLPAIQTEMPQIAKKTEKAIPKPTSPNYKRELAGKIEESEQKNELAEFYQLKKKREELVQVSQDPREIERIDEQIHQRGVYLNQTYHLNLKY